MLKCHNYEVSRLDSTKTLYNRYTGFGCKTLEEPYITMRDCEGYYINGKIFKVVDGYLK